MGNTDHKSLRVFLSFVLAFSLIGVAGLQTLSQAFADEMNKAIEDIQPSEAESSEVEYDELEKPEDSIDPENLSPKGNKIDEEDQVSLQSDQEIKQSLGNGKPHYDYKYVYEGVYGGVFGDEYTIATNRDIKDGWYEETGALISASQGEMFENGIEFSPYITENALNNKVKYIPFKQNGKWGLLEFATKQIVVNPSYTRVSQNSGGYGGDCWGFLYEGSSNAEGIYPDAKVVFFQGGSELFSYSLNNYIEMQRYDDIFYSDYRQAWCISWNCKLNNGNTGTSDIYLSNDFELSPDINSQGSITPDGHEVRFAKNDDNKVVAKVSELNGANQKTVVLDTNQTSFSNFSTISNLICVRGSNGFDYQYFSLNGELLQSMNGQYFLGLGNYVAYSRISFVEQIPVQVFLDTNALTSADAISIPALGADFRYSNGHSYFDCITPDNKIQRYDAELNKILEFNSSLDANALYEQGERSFNCHIDELTDQMWLITEWIGNSLDYDHGNKKAFHVVKRVGDSERDLPYTFFGFSTPNIRSSGIHADKVYLMEDNDEFKLRVFDQDLAFFKEVDCSTLFPEGSSMKKLGVNSGSYTKFLGLTILYADEEGKYVSKNYTLDSQFNFFSDEYEEINSLNGKVYKAKKNGKWGFVDSNLKPLSSFSYYDINVWELSNGEAYFEAWKNYYGLRDLFDENIVNVLGFSYSWLEDLENGCYWIDNSLYKGNSLTDLTKVSLLGYQLVKERPWSSTRVLSNNNIMVYVKDSEGKIGAIDTMGNVVIPLEYKDFRENTNKKTSGGYIMLKDDEGWFFVDAGDLQPSGPNKDCDIFGHDYESAIYEPTCTTDGYTQYVCKRCGYGERDESSIVAALGHDYRQLSFEKEPTCTEVGSYDYFVCSRCGAEEGSSEERPALGHQWDPKSQYIQYPTCTENGSAKHACLRCGVEEEYVVSAYGHRWSYSPEWTWSSDFQTVTARTACTNGCGEYLPLEVSLDHENVEGGTRHSAVVNIYGRDVKDGRLTLGWTDENGVSRNLLVKGAPVADGFYAWPQDLKIPADEGSSIVIDVTPVREGGIFDALVSKIGSGWPAGTFEVKLNIDDDEVHDGFGSLKFAFPAGGGSIGKKAVIYHCHKNDRDNITSHDVVVDDNGMIVLDKITDLSTFALEILEDEATSTGPSANNSKVSGLPSTGDSTASLMVVVPLALECLAFAIAFFFILRRRRSC